MPKYSINGTCAYLFSPDEESCDIFSTRNNCCEFLASYGVIIQSVFQSHRENVVKILTVAFVKPIFCRGIVEHHYFNMQRFCRYVLTSNCSFNIEVGFSDCRIIHWDYYKKYLKKSLIWHKILIHYIKSMLYCNNEFK